MSFTFSSQVPYYVKENFHTDYQGSLRRLEMSIEEEYIGQLKYGYLVEKWRLCLTL
jgi:DnaJ homolog subfamily B member 12